MQKSHILFVKKKAHFHKWNWMFPWRNVLQKQEFGTTPKKISETYETLS